jgi:hypothetical protein
MLSQTTPNNTPYRKARTRTLIQLGGLIEKSGLLESFDIVIGDNLQQNLEKKEQVFALLGGLLELKEMMNQQEFPLDLLSQKGAKSFNADKKK